MSQKKPQKPKPAVYAGPLKTPAVDPAGHILFQRYAEEQLKGESALLESLPPASRSMVIDWYADALAEGISDNTVHNVLWETDFVRKPVTIDQFVEDPYYLGRTCAGLDPPLKSDLCNVFSPGSGVSEWILTGSIGYGKGGLSHHNVLTTEGWRTYGDLKKGDHVIGSDGYPVNVTGVYPRGVLPVYRVKFTDGASVVVDGDHLWSVRTPTDVYKNKDGRVYSTRELMSRGVKNKLGQRRWHIPVLSNPVEFPEKELPIRPYALGALLGDGGLTAGGIKFSSEDFEILERVVRETGLTANNVPGTCDYRLVYGTRGGGDGNGPCNPVLDVLRDLGVCVLSPEKRIPKSYFTASAWDRLSLLRGLMDTDGWTQHGCPYFASSSEGLRDDVVSLVRSLGGTATKTFKKTKKRGSYGSCINIRQNPFHLTRKSESWRPAEKYMPRRMIDSIEPVGFGDVICISVDARDSLYVTEDYVVTHNTTIAMAGMAYKVYYLSCLRDPARYYGLQPKSKIVFGVYSITKRTVADTGYSKLRGYFDNSEYFRDKFPRNRKIDSKIQFLKHNIEVVAGSQELHAIGLDMYSMSLDEVNFMQMKKDKETRAQIGQAYTLYTATSTRIESRFMRAGGTIPGIMIVMSSRKAQTDFLEQRIKKAAGDRSTRGLRGKVGTSYITDYALWDVKPPERFPGKPFTVVIGDRTRKSEIIKEGDIIPHGAETVQVPGDFRRAFDSDIEAALRDIAGRATFNTSPLIRDRSSLTDAIAPGLKHPFKASKIVIGEKDDYTIDEYFDRNIACRVDGSNWKPKINPGAPRYMHVDLSLTGDCAGIAMSHAAGIVKNKTQNPDGTFSFINRPRVIVDLMLQIVPPQGSETDLSKILSFVLFLRQIYNLVLVSFDGYQSRHSSQILRKQKIESLELSVDRSEDPYVSLRALLFDRQLSIYDYPPFIQEMLFLERDMDHRKVDHPEKFPDGSKGRKDVADAVCGSVWWCLNDDRAMQGAALLDASDPVLHNLPAILPPGAVAAPSLTTTAARRVDPINVASPIVVAPSGQTFDWERLRKNMTGEKE